MNLRELRQAHSQLSLQKRSQPEKRTEAITGFRVWKVEREGGLPKLHSVTQKFSWPYRKALVRDTFCDMGIHAIKRAAGGLGGGNVWDPAGLHNYGLTGLYFSYGAHVAGEVYLWGKVTEYSEGYLAEYAYPKRLFCPPEMDPVTCMQLEDEYGIPSEYREEFARPAPQQQAPAMIQPAQINIVPSPWSNFGQVYTYTTSGTFPTAQTIGGFAQGINCATQQLGLTAAQAANQLLGLSGTYDINK